MANDPLSRRLADIEEAIAELKDLSRRQKLVNESFERTLAEHGSQLRDTGVEIRQQDTSTAAGQLRVNLGSLPFILGGFALVVAGELTALLASL